MNKLRTLWVAISHHGYGHLGQTSPVLIELKNRCPNIAIIVQSGHPAALLQDFLPFDFRHVAIAADQPILMHNAMALDIPATVLALQDYHRNAAEIMATLSHRMQEMQVDAVVSNIGYFPLVAAKAIGIPALAFCSLNWADILAAYAPHEPSLVDLIASIRDWYAQADRFFAPQPHMPMPLMNNVISVGSVARQGRRVSLAALIGKTENMRFGLVSLGGIAYPIDYAAWPAIPGWTWIVTRNSSCITTSVRDDIIYLDDLPVSHLQVMASADMLVTKPGYGSFTEAGCAGTPVVSLPRPDWPETAPMLEWLSQHVPVRLLEESCLLDGTGLPACAAWREQLAHVRRDTSPTGINEAVGHICHFLALDGN